MPSKKKQPKSLELENKKTHGNNTKRRIANAIRKLVCSTKEKEMTIHTLKQYHATKKWRKGIEVIIH